VAIHGKLSSGKCVWVVHDEEKPIIA